MEDRVMAQAAWSRAEMAAFDAMPAPLRRFIADYPRGLPMLRPNGVLQAWKASEGDIDLTMHALRLRFPVRVS